MSLDQPIRREIVGSQVSAMSWAGIIAGAITASAVGLLLFAGATSFGLAIFSPYSATEHSAAVLGVSGIAVTILIEIIAFGIGGYIAGRLRTHANDLPGDETTFRDTAQGLVVWGLSTVISAYFLSSILGTLGAGAGLATAASVAAQVPFAQLGETGGTNLGQAQSGVAPADNDQNARLRGQREEYLIDRMLRQSSTTTPVSMSQPADKREIGRILKAGVSSAGIPDADKTYLAQTISRQTGLSPADSQARIDELVQAAKSDAARLQTEAMQEADTARKAGAAGAFIGFISLLIGAFTASYMAVVGGRLRDRL